MYKKVDKTDPEEMKNYHVFAPTIFIQDSIEDKRKKMYKLVVLRFNQITFAYLLKNEELEEYQYTLLYERSEAAAANLSEKTQTLLNYYSQNYMSNDSDVKFFYFNEANLAIKFSPSIGTEVLNTELRHFLNIIKEKFASNPNLEEYKITTSSFWLVGVRSLSRMIVLMLPLSLSLIQMENEKRRIVNRYFSQFIF